VRSRITAGFRRQLNALPSEVRSQAERAYELFATDPWHGDLKFKQIHGQHGIWSVRIGRRHRAIGIRDGNVVTWQFIGTHADYDSEVKKRR
jgi:hypothetical protein